jgi:hypothetical protein
MNIGLSAESGLKNAFPDINPSARVEVKIPEKLVGTNWLAGFVEGERSAVVFFY